MILVFSRAGELGLIYANAIALANTLNTLTFFPHRNHHGAHHDDTQHHRQEVAAQSVVRDGHGPLRVRLLHLRVRGADRVRDAALLREQPQMEQKQRQEEEKPGEEIPQDQDSNSTWVLFQPSGLQSNSKFSWNETSARFMK